MKITYRWLQDFVAIDGPPSTLARQLTEAGLEVESLAPVAPPFSGVLVGAVVDCRRHPDAEKLSVCQVTTDGSNRLQIVCGAPNVRAGLKVAVAMEGARLPNDVLIKRAKLRGLESQGMLCSARELGLGEEHDGILELPADLDLNRDLRAALDLDDTILEVNATPNRGDCMSVFGIARDYAAAQHRRLLRHQGARVPPVSEAVFPVRLLAGVACPRFASRVIRGIRTGVASPPWLRERLRRIGQGSISPVVDVTNYVMAELGQPLHAYDLGRLGGGIEVRWARDAERITLLDAKEYLLDPECLVVADDHAPIGLAGIMGGGATAISQTTRDVLLEAAHFTPGAIAGRARRLGLLTDASQRFERGVDPELPTAAIERATALLLDIFGGAPGPISLAEGGSAHAAQPVTLRRNRLSSLLGIHVPDAEVEKLLRAISDRVASGGEGWQVTPPSHRFDLHIEADLVEEVARLRGFESIAESDALTPQRPGRAPEGRVANDRLLFAMVDRGYREAITYSFVDAGTQRLLFPGTPALALTNPISAELGEMRISLWPGLIHACRENLRRQQARVRLFEIGHKFVCNREELEEIETLAGIVAGPRWPEQWGAGREAADFYDIKADLAAVFTLTGESKPLNFEARELSCLHPGRSARIVRGAEPVGWLGELHPQLVRSLNLPVPPWLFELEVEACFASKIMSFRKLSKFPSVRRDLSVVMDESIPLALLRENVSVSASGLLTELRIFDIYRGPGIDSGRKSIALGLILQDSSRTLTDSDADAVIAAVVTRLRDVLSATIRD